MIESRLNPTNDTKSIMEADRESHSFGVIRMSHVGLDPYKRASAGIDLILEAISEDYDEAMTALRKDERFMDIAEYLVNS